MHLYFDITVSSRFTFQKRNFFFLRFIIDLNIPIDHMYPNFGIVEFSPLAYKNVVSSFFVFYSPVAKVDETTVEVNSSVIQTYPDIC